MKHYKLYNKYKQFFNFLFTFVSKLSQIINMDTESLHKTFNPRT